MWGDDYSRKAINQGTAIIRGNTVFLLYPDCTYLARTKILAMLGTGSLLAEVSHFSFHFCLVGSQAQDHGQAIYAKLRCSVSSTFATGCGREGTGYFLKIAKINSQREKPMGRNRKK